jgi:hypothetical protein
MRSRQDADTEERERLENYLAWRRARLDERSDARRRWLREHAILVSFLVVAVGVFAALTVGARDAWWRWRAAPTPVRDVAATTPAATSRIPEAVSPATVREEPAPAVDTAPSTAASSSAPPADAATRGAADVQLPPRATTASRARQATPRWSKELPARRRTQTDVAASVRPSERVAPSSESAAMPRELPAAPAPEASAAPALESPHIAAPAPMPSPSTVAPAPPLASPSTPAAAQSPVASAPRTSTTSVPQRAGGAAVGQATLPPTAAPQGVPPLPARPTRPQTAQADSVAATPLPTADTTRASCAALKSTEGPLTERARMKGRALGDCVGGWLKGELQEFKDGVDKVRSKLGLSR